MKIFKMATIAAGCAGLLLAGCEGGKKEEPVQAPAAEAPAAEAPAAEAPEAAGEPGGIKITVAFEGKAPEGKELNRKSDPYCAKIKKVDPSVMVKDGKVQNAVVRIESKVKSDAAPSADPVMVSQHECMYEPRVQVGMVGQQIAVENHDKTLHNVHAYKGENKENWFNAAQPPKAPAIQKDLDDGMVQLKCDVHPWMSAFLSVAEHPFNSVTGEDGTVTWTNVPSKSKPYKVMAWHEVFGKQEQEVKVEPGMTAEVTFTFKADQAAN
jgi:plastocyanin